MWTMLSLYMLLYDLENALKEEFEMAFSSFKSHRLQKAVVEEK